MTTRRSLINSLSIFISISSTLFPSLSSASASSSVASCSSPPPSTITASPIFETAPPSLPTSPNQQVMLGLGRWDEMSFEEGYFEEEGEEGGLRKRQTSSTSSVSIPETAAAGSLIWVAPATAQGTTYIKVYTSNTVTFEWSLSNVISTPASLTFQAYCPENSYTYSLSSVPGSATSMLWDPYAYNQSPGVRQFIDATYTLMVFDERGPTAGTSPGKMSPNTGVQFGMYSPEPYTPLASWTCAACFSGGMLGVKAEMMTVVMMVVATVVAVGAGGMVGRW